MLPNHHHCSKAQTARHAGTPPKVCTLGEPVKKDKRSIEKPLNKIDLAAIEYAVTIDPRGEEARQEVTQAVTNKRKQGAKGFPGRDIIRNYLKSDAGSNEGWVQL